jgi:hypothetical protein
LAGFQVPPEGKGRELFRPTREHLAKRVTEKMAGGRLEMIAPPDEGRQFAICHRPMRLIHAIWQRFAEEIAGMIRCAQGPAPNCGRWFPGDIGRSDRQFCCHACQMRAWRVG